MRKYLSLVLALLMVVGMVGIANAQDSGRYGRENQDEVGYVDVASAQNDAVLVAAPCYIYGVTVFADAASSFVKIYDAATAAAVTAGGVTVKVEIGESTQYDSRRYAFDKPIKMNSGAYVDVTSGSVALEYRQ